MDRFEVILMPAVVKFYRTCPAELAQRLNKCFEDLERNPFFGPNIKLLKGEKRRYRYRLGEYRVIYMIDKPARKAVVTLISARPSAYRNIS